MINANIDDKYQLSSPNLQRKELHRQSGYHWNMKKETPPKL